MRGAPKAGFRLTEKRIAAGILSKALMDAHIKIEKLTKEGKPLPKTLIQRAKEMQENQARAKKGGLLNSEISNLHAVDKSAIRRDFLLRRTG